MLVKSSWSPSSCAVFFIASSFETCCLSSFPVVGDGAVSPIGPAGPGGVMLAWRADPPAPANFCCSSGSPWHCREFLFVRKFFLLHDGQIHSSHRTDPS